ncbi:cobalamin B12-binding domain-containing protein [Allochromatium palmeri]|uniref:Cobalamin-binding protein n=1 Tax=Allochromatium palmeri TaxID=231048 RepID=A0A6N8E8F7_9GAMM|nr:cobalamin-dependent protein [Allochromatium palmeri]MTW19780.1 cobalamin-binding protein [Allochromatium palmeri]
MSSSSDALLQALLALNRVQAQELLAQARAEYSPLEVIEILIRPALEELGQLWEGGDCALSQIYMSGRICEELLEELFGEALSDDLPETDGPPRLGIAVLEDYHLLGKQIVRTVLRAAGYRVHDYGRQDVDTLLEQVRADGIEVLLISTLMLPAALRVRTLIERLREVAPGVRVVVGGAPYRFDDQLWREVGADAVGLSAGDILPILERLGVKP